MQSEQRGGGGGSASRNEPALSVWKGFLQRAQGVLSRRGFVQGMVSAAVMACTAEKGSARDVLNSDRRSRKTIDDASKPKPDLVDLADPNIGGIGHLLTSLDPEVQLPHGMALIAPVVAPDVTDSYLASRVFGFSIGGSILMVSDREHWTAADLSSEWDHDFDSVRPSEASYVLQDSGIRVEYTVAAHSAHFRFSVNEARPIRLILRPMETGQYRAIHNTTVTGVEDRQRVRSYIYLVLSHPVLEQQAFVPELPQVGPPARHDAAPTGLVLSWPAGLSDVEVRIGISYIDLEQAKRNLAFELPKSDFDGSRRRARAAWNSSLGKIQVRGGTDEEKTIFYTALYRSLQFMKDITEEGRYYGPYDHQVHSADGRRFFIEDNLWDTYRCRHPLQTILEPDVNEDQIQSFVRLYEESGWLPQFPFMAGDLLFMNGNHAAAMILDSYVKGQRNFDIEKAYQGAKKASLQATMLPYRRGPLTELDRFYAEHGYFPALRNGEPERVSEVHLEMRRQAVSVTLDAAYDDWALHELAKFLGKQEDASFFGKRALNYRNVYNAQTGWMEPRDIDGKFIPGFNPKWSGGQAGRDYFTECNGWVFQFDVQHDIGGLIALMGGREKFIERLDALFSEGYDGSMKYVFLSQFPDSTALIGQYPQGNEPAFHIPYLYNYAGQPWKSQRRVRQILQNWYAARPLGLPGDDDNGAMTSWYVFGALGFYPVCPGRPVYTIVSPIFEEARIDLGHGRVFTIIAHGASRTNKYIQSARLNGQSLERTWFSHAELAEGGTLELMMGPHPNLSWGTGIDAAPPSFTNS